MKLFTKAVDYVRVFGQSEHRELISRDRGRVAEPVLPLEERLEAAMAWLCRAQDACADGGVSWGYSFHRGWRPPYPETTGYILSTFLRYARTRGRPEFRERAIRMADWEIKIQLDSGACRGGMGVLGAASVFNTGQIMRGWNDLYYESNESRYLEASVRAARWLASVQDADGTWRRHTHGGIPHAYKTLVAWPMLEVARITNDDALREAGERFVRWCLAGAASNGFMPWMGFSEHEAPLTHTIAYTLDGLLRCAELDVAPQTRARAHEAFDAASEGLLKQIELDAPPSTERMLAGRFDSQWQPGCDYCCLTGNAQLASAWLRRHAQTLDARLPRAATMVTEQVALTQSLGSRHPGIRGGVAASYPIWGRYNPYTFPNWPPKFYADALMDLCEARQGAQPHWTAGVSA